MSAAGMQAGAAAGSAFGPWGTVAGAVAGGFMDSGGGGAAMAPSAANSTFGTELVFDNSGWNVAFSGSKIDSKASKTNDMGGTSPGMLGSMDTYLPYAILAVAFLVVWRTAKK